MKEQLLELKLLMKKGGLSESAEVADELIDKQDMLTTQGNLNSNVGAHINGRVKTNAPLAKKINAGDSDSEVTVCRDTVQSCKNFGRLSSSSEEDVDSSTEMVDINQVIKLINIVGNKKKCDVGRT